MGSKNARMMKVAGLSFVGFCAVSFAADRVPGVGPAASQVAGFCGAFLGAVVGRTRLQRKSTPGTDDNQQPGSVHGESNGDVAVTAADK